MIEYENLLESNKLWLSELESAAVNVLRNGWYVLGQELKKFEKEFAEYNGSKYCIGVGNGLDALVLSLEALELTPRSEILVASNTYIATIIAIIRAGHVPILVEPDPSSYNIDPKKLKEKLKSNTRAICITHLYGKPCKMNEIISFVNEHHLFLIEDCAQSHGSSFREKKTGTFGIAGCFSFYPTKNLGGFGDGGAIITDDDNFADKLFHLRNYGAKIKYQNEYLGFNSRLDEIQAALLRVKLRYIDKIINHKRNLAEIYFNTLPDFVVKPSRTDEEFDVYHIFAIQSDKRDLLKKWLLEGGIKTESHYPTPPHFQKAMKKYLNGSYPISENIHSKQLSLPISIGNTSDEIIQVSKRISDFKNVNLPQK
jgi:dTDP-4-amino-4,6-dideoxygalactose transaminase